MHSVTASMKRSRHEHEERGIAEEKEEVNQQRNAHDDAQRVVTIRDAFNVSAVHAYEDAWFYKKRKMACLMRSKGVCECHVCAKYEPAHPDDDRKYVFTHICLSCKKVFRCVLPRPRRFGEIPNKNVSCRCIIQYVPGDKNEMHYFCGNGCFWAYND